MCSFAEILGEMQQTLSELTNSELLLNELLQELSSHTNLSNLTQIRIISTLQNFTKEALLSSKLYLRNATRNNEMFKSITSMVSYIAAGLLVVLEHLDTVNKQEMLTNITVDTVNVSR